MNTHNLLTRHAASKYGGWVKIVIRQDCLITPWQASIERVPVEYGTTL